MAGVNAAQRIVDCLIRRSQIGPNASMIDGLKTLFDYIPIEPYREHSKRLELLLTQIDAVESSLKNLSFPEHLYSQRVNTARNAFSPSALNNSWSHVLNNVTPDVELAFMWAAYAMPDEIDQLDASTLAEFKEQIISLKSDPMLAKLPPTLRDLITKYFESILDAISTYSITGNAPFEKAATDLTVKIILEKDTLEAETTQVTKEAEPFFKQAKSFIKKTVDVVVATGKGADAIDKVLKLATEKGPLLLELVNKI
jgi:hypothetical protein